MTFLDIIIIFALCAAAYVLGQKSVEQKSSTKKGQNQKKNYEQIDEHDDEEKISVPLVENPVIKPSQLQQAKDVEEKTKNFQKERDKLMQEIADFKQKERKYLAEIQFLKTKVNTNANSAGPQQQKPNTNDKQSVISDQEFDSLIDTTSTNIMENKEINPDEINEEIAKALN